MIVVTEAAIDTAVEAVRYQGLQTAGELLQSRLEEMRGGIMARLDAAGLGSSYLQAAQDAFDLCAQRILAGVEAGEHRPALWPAGGTG